MHLSPSPFCRDGAGGQAPNQRFVEDREHNEDGNNSKHDTRNLCSPVQLVQLGQPRDSQRQRVHQFPRNQQPRQQIGVPRAQKAYQQKRAHDGFDHGNGYAEENIKANVNAHVNKPSESVSAAAAVFVGDYHNTSNALIGDNSVVDVSDVLTVKANTVIPNQVTFDDDWDEFKDLDLEKVKKLLKIPVIIDGRNIFNPAKVKRLGFTYKSIGR